jgi:hypothetical protein
MRKMLPILHRPKAISRQQKPAGKGGFMGQTILPVSISMIDTRQNRHLSDFRAAAVVGKGNALRATAGETLDNDAARRAAHNPRITETGIARGSPCFAFATSARGATAVAVGVTRIANDRAYAVGTNAQLDVLRTDRRCRRNPCKAHGKR